jgi:hypothetical protein
MKNVELASVGQEHDKKTDRQKSVFLVIALFFEKKKSIKMKSFIHSIESKVPITLSLVSMSDNCSNDEKKFVDRAESILLI